MQRRNGPCRVGKPSFRRHHRSGRKGLAEIGPTLDCIIPAWPIPDQPWRNLRQARPKWPQDWSAWARSQSWPNGLTRTKVFVKNAQPRAKQMCCFEFPEVWRESDRVCPREFSPKLARNGPSWEKPALAPIRGSMLLSNAARSHVPQEREPILVFASNVPQVLCRRVPGNSRPETGRGRAHEADRCVCATHVCTKLASAKCETLGAIEIS